MANERQAAILLTYLGEETAAEILSHLPHEIVVRLARALSHREVVSATEAEEVALRFLEMLRAPSGLGDTGLLQKSLLERMQAQTGDASLVKSFAEQERFRSLQLTLEALPLPVLVRALQNEHPQVIAVALSLAPSARAGELLHALPASLQCGVIARVAVLEEVDEVCLDDLAVTLESLQKKGGEGGVKLGGVDTASRLLEGLNTDFRNALLDKLQDKDTALAQELRKRSLDLNKIAQLSCRDLAKVLAKVDNKNLALALKLYKESEREPFFAAVSRIRGEELREFLASDRPVRRADAENAVAKLIELVLAMKNNDEIVFPWEEEFV